MPRINKAGIAYVYMPGVKYGAEFADICWFCYHLEDLDKFSISHPPYEKQNPLYVCPVCGKELGERDN